MKMRTPHRRLHVLARWLLAPLLVLLAWTSPSDGLAYVSASGPRGAEAPQGQDATPTPPPPEDRVEPGLRSAILAAPGQRASFLVYLSAQADLSGAYAIDDWEARGRYVFERLQESGHRGCRGVPALLHRECDRCIRRGGDPRRPVGQSRCGFHRGDEDLPSARTDW